MHYTCTWVQNFRVLRVKFLHWKLHCQATLKSRLQYYRHIGHQLFVGVPRCSYDREKLKVVKLHEEQIVSWIESVILKLKWERNLIGEIINIHFPLVQQTCFTGFNKWRDFCHKIKAKRGNRLWRYAFSRGLVKVPDCRCVWPKCLMILVKVLDDNVIVLDHLLKCLMISLNI